MVTLCLRPQNAPRTLSGTRSAIQLNHVAAENNIRAFRWGRRAAHDPAALRARTRPPRGAGTDALGSLDALIEQRARALTDYQNDALAQRYREGVASIRAAEAQLGMGCEALSEAVARSYFSLLAYKDEYEVARLYTNGELDRKSVV